ncbi:MAG: hypothetical protein ACK456_02890 [Pseudanabaenaceae cyanobacterium]|jgi:hypothetical protein
MNMIRNRWAFLPLLFAAFLDVSVGNQFAYAQRPANLFSMCQYSGHFTSSGPINKGGGDLDVVIGRELFTSIMSAWAYGGSAACRIRPGNSGYKYKTLRLAFGIQDENSENYNCRKPMTVNVYLDGNLAESRSLLPSEKSLLLLNVSRTSTVTVDVPRIGESGFGGTCWGVVYFTQAILEPISR